MTAIQEINKIFAEWDKQATEDWLEALRQEFEPGGIFYKPVTEKFWRIHPNARFETSLP